MNGIIVDQVTMVDIEVVMVILQMVIHAEMDTILVAGDTTAGNGVALLLHLPMGDTIVDHHVTEAIVAVIVDTMGVAALMEYATEADLHQWVGAGNIIH